MITICIYPPLVPILSMRGIVVETIPFGVALRLKRNCSEDELFAKKSVEYKSYLGIQGYPASWLMISF